MPGVDRLGADLDAKRWFSARDHTRMQPFPARDGKWHHVAGTFDGAVVRLYVDGKQVGNGTPATLTINYNTPGGNDLFIGNYFWPGTWGFAGSIDELSIYNRALSASEIQTISTAGAAGKSNLTAPATSGVAVDLETGVATGLAGGVAHAHDLVGSPHAPGTPQGHTHD
jgi:Concanavalin A-like lectin/glucanases superfamily